MSSYSAHTYKTHYVCFDCRKQFKRPNAFALLARDGSGDLYNRLDMKQKGMIQVEGEAQPMTEKEKTSWAELRKKYFGSVLCPQCSQPMTKVGNNFEAPKSTDLRQWEMLRTKFATEIDHV